ncbi:MAG: DNA gyrase subunit A [Fastidiosipilaceae bacterium]|jgi:DNA gyrase subunit A
MARKSKEPIRSVVEPYLTEEIITDTLEQNYMPYAMSVIVSRAIPEIDGFKPSHRKLLYTMYKMGLQTSTRTKSANVVGQTMKLNPHGDQAIYETMVRMTRGNEALLHPYVDSKGNFGKQYSRDMQYAAPRYTEVALEPFCREIFAGIDRDAVDLIDNYDGTLKEPLLLPVSFPSVLINANQGIAVGMASNVCSFNLEEVCKATVAFIDDPSCDLLDIMPAPDFSGGAELLYDRDQMKAIYQTGRGGFKLRGRYTVDRKNNLIEVSEIPYSTTIEQIIEDIGRQIKSGKLKEVLDVRDETDLNGLKVTIDYRRTADPDQVMKKLFASTPLVSSFSCNFNILVNGHPRVMGVRQILAEWLIFRRGAVRREVGFDLRSKQDRLHLLVGLEQILLDIDKAIRIVRQTKLEEEVVPNLMEGFGIDETQAEYVAEIKLRNLNRQYILRRTADIKKLKSEIRSLKKKLADPSLIDADIKETLLRVAEQYGQPRRTQLIDLDDVEMLTEEDLIKDFRLKAFLTRDGYLKKLALTSLRSAGELKTKEDDAIVQEVAATNRSELIFLTNHCNAYKVFLHELEDQRPSDLGAYLPNELDMDEGELPLFMIAPGENYSGSLLVGFRNGKVARLPLNSYQTKTRRKKLVKAFSDASPAVGFALIRSVDEMTEEETAQLTDAPEVAVKNTDDVFMLSDTNKAVLFDADLITEKVTRDTVGVQVLSGKRRGDVVLFKSALETREDLEDAEHYRIRKIPHIGYYLKEDTLEYRQIGLSEMTATSNVEAAKNED